MIVLNAIVVKLPKKPVKGLTLGLTGFKNLLGLATSPGFSLTCSTMQLDTQHIWKELGNEFFFFILKRVRDEEITKEILQNSFLKIHRNLASLKEESKVRPWAYQIVRNEIANFHNQKLVTKTTEIPSEKADSILGVDSFCCFEKFINNLPQKYRSVIEEVYLKGNSQAQTAANLNITLSNTKARIHRAKEILKTNFQECCNYELNSQGMLVGEPDCESCSK